LIVSITGFGQNQIPEDAAFRTAVDAALETAGEQSPHTVANTIFPQSLWRLAGGNRERLYEIYIQSFPRLQALAKRQNRRGLYFERLIRWSSTGERNNQLEWIIGQYRERPSVRRSALQASIFDPERDHIPDAQLGFPCLQQISFVPEGSSLVMNAFYAKQSLFQKGYGNYLGLCRLGLFMAGEMGLTLERVNVTIGVAELEMLSKSSPIVKDLQRAAQLLCNPAFAA
jgi:thymidylate synthase